MKLKSSFEDFAQSVMHPLESGYQQARQSPTKMAQSGQQQPPMSSNNGAAAFSLKGPHQLSETRWSLLKHRNELVPNFENKTRKNLDPGDLLRPRSRTVDDRVDFNPPQCKLSKLSMNFLTFFPCLICSDSKPVCPRQPL